MKNWFAIIALVSFTATICADDPPKVDAVKVEDAVAPIIKAWNEQTQLAPAVQNTRANTVEGAKARRAVKDASEAYYGAIASLRGTKPGVNGTILVASGKFLSEDGGAAKILINDNIVVFCGDPNNELVNKKPGDDVTLQGRLVTVRATPNNGKEPWIFMLQNPKIDK